MPARLPMDFPNSRPTLPVDAGEIFRLRRDAKPFPRREAVSLLHSLSPRRRLVLHEAARLLATADPMVWETAAVMARAVREEVFGRRVVLFAPLYLSNDCGNNCLYCGFRRGNRDAVRITLSPEQAVAEARHLEKKGFRRILLVAGEHPGKTSVEYIVEVLRAIYRGTGMRILHVNAAPMPVESFRALKEAGAGVYQCFQETYHPETYARMHPSGAKADYAWRVTAMDRAISAGFGDVGIGALLGLFDYRFEALSVLRHAEHLHETYGAYPHTISVPRFKRAFGAPVSAAPVPVSDAEFERIVVLYRLAVPSAGVVVSTREPAALRERCLDIGASQISAGSKTDPGGYGDGFRRRESEQFEVDDTRSIGEMVDVLLRRGHLPSLCTSCYRLHRTGDTFTEMALDGHIRDFCLPNALLSLAEYAVENADAGLRDRCLAAVEEGRRELASSPLRGEFESKLAEVLSGGKDRRF
ncbi:MAG: [FeFe] hydrogenase H-cluster radical SAM maturase HydG [Deltaproteobacteria bacterium]|nr:[FeFe] hydrogenase H-cluster radical SAM maturase HydG [Deltaproteobacteria bacterium]